MCVFTIHNSQNKQIIVNNYFESLKLPEEYNSCASMTYQNRGDTLDDELVPGGDDEDRVGGEEAGPLRDDQTLPHGWGRGLTMTM